MRLKYIIRNSFAVGAFIVVVYIFVAFYSGTALNKNIQGTWTAVEYSDTYTFTENEYIHGAERGFYKIRGNKIILLGCEDKEYYVRIKNECLVINGEFYLEY